MGSHRNFPLLSLDKVRDRSLLTSAVIEAEPKEYHRAERHPLGDVQHRRVASTAWFEENIQTNCKMDLSTKNSVVLDALAGTSTALHEGRLSCERTLTRLLPPLPLCPCRLAPHVPPPFRPPARPPLKSRRPPSVMRTAACAVNNSTNTYYYVDALQAARAADLYLYQLPLGLPLLNATVPSCDACVQRVKGAFAEGGAGIDALTETYAEVGTVNRACGAVQAAGSGATGLRARRAAAVVSISPPSSSPRSYPMYGPTQIYLY